MKTGHNRKNTIYLFWLKWAKYLFKNSDIGFVSLILKSNVKAPVANTY